MSTRTQRSVIESSHWIGGEPISSRSVTTVQNPADVNEVVGTIPVGGSEEVDDAVRAANDAFQSWSRKPIQERAELLLQASEEVLVEAERRAITLVRESGKILTEAQGEQMAGSRVLRYYGEVGSSYSLVSEMDAPNGVVKIAREPMGVVAVIVPWNAPILLGMLSVAPALLAGNTVVVKPSREAPLALIDFLKAVARLLPSGVINVVAGDEEVGNRLVTHPDVRRVMFTGSTEVGRVVAAAAMETLKRVSLELGGNDPALVLDDADLDGDIVPELIMSTFPTSGQVCYAVKRIYVPDSMYPDFVERFTSAAAELNVGNGLDPAADLGPLINRRQLQFVKSLVSDAENRGADVVPVGTALDPNSWDMGWFHLPTVVTEIDQAADLVQTEQFGPVIPILRYGSIEQGIRLANDTSYGLASSIWTSDEERGFDLARLLEAGTTFVNTHRPGSSAVDMPFGGMKESGIGRGHGIVALDEQFELHTISSRRPG